MNEVDLRFSRAVSRTAGGDAAELVEMLRSDAPLGREEREVLALLIDELASRPPMKEKPGRPSGSEKVHRRDQWKAVAEYRQSMDRGILGKNAALDVAREYGVTKNTLLSWNTEIKSAEQRMKDSGLPNWRFGEWSNLPE